MLFDHFSLSAQVPNNPFALQDTPLMGSASIAPFKSGLSRLEELKMNNPFETIHPKVKISAYN